MNKLNKKGFMMAEVIIVSAMVMVALAAFYASYNKIISSYDNIKNYEKVSVLYRLGEIRDGLIDATDANSIESLLASIDETNIIELTLSNGLVQEKDKYEKSFIFKLTRDSKITSEPYKYLISETVLNEFNNKNQNNTFNDYINYLSTSKTFNSEYLMALETCDSSKTNCDYSYLELYKESVSACSNAAGLVRTSKSDNPDIFAYQTSLIDGSSIKKHYWKNTTDADANIDPIGKDWYPNNTVFVLKFNVKKCDYTSKINIKLKMLYAIDDHILYNVSNQDPKEERKQVCATTSSCLYTNVITGDSTIVGKNSLTDLNSSLNQKFKSDPTDPNYFGNGEDGHFAKWSNSKWECTQAEKCIIPIIFEKNTFNSKESNDIEFTIEKKDYFKGNEDSDKNYYIYFYLPYDTRQNKSCYNEVVSSSTTVSYTTE